MKFTEWIRHRIVGRLREPDYRELQEIAQKAKLLAGVYNHGELAKLIREYSHSEKAIEQIALLIAKSEPFDSPISTMKKVIRKYDGCIDGYSIYGETRLSTDGYPTIGSHISAWLVRNVHRYA